MFSSFGEAGCIFNKIFIFESDFYLLSISSRPVMKLRAFSATSLEDLPDLQSVPQHRRLTKNPLIERLRLAVPHDFIAISGLDVDDFRFGQRLCFDTNLPPAFIETYIIEELGRIDPFRDAALKTEGTIIESEVYTRSAPPQRLAYLASSFGIHNRTLFPITRNGVTYGAITLTRTEPFETDEIAFMETVADTIHAAVTKPLRQRFVAQHMKLTPGELICLTNASFGLTSDEIAKTTGYQPDTVNSYIKSAIKKLGAENRSHAIAEAIRRRLIR
ncbi:helix-turn-helix transcriptional regulator [Rhizobium daejeonense]